MISLIHPSRGRVSMAFTTAKGWAFNAKSAYNVEYILVVDESDECLEGYSNNIDRLNRYFHKVHLVISEGNNVVQAMNFGAGFTRGNIIVGISDDFNCPLDWDEYLLSHIDPKKEQALQVNDGRISEQVDILTLPILTRKLYLRLGYIYFHEYKGWCADNDLAEKCKQLGVLVKDYSQTFEHYHWRNGKRQKDNTDGRHDSAEGAKFGNDLLAKRRVEKFA